MTTASGIDRAIACPASEVFPRVYRATEYSDRGDEIHGYSHAVLTGTTAAVALASLDTEVQATCRSLDWETLVGDLDPTTYESEAAYAINVRTRTARFLGRNIARDYAGAAARTGQPLGEDEIPGTLDIAGLGRVTYLPKIRDIKSGFRAVPAAKRNGQVKFFAAVKHIMLDAPEVESAIAKVRPDGSVRLDSAVFTAYEIDAFLDDLEVSQERVRAARRVYLAGGTPSVTEGPHCTYCPAFDSCPAKTGLARNLLASLDQLEMDLRGAMSPEDSARVYEAIRDRAKPIVERIESTQQDRARAEPLPLSNGQVLREAPYERAYLNEEMLVALARAKGATDAEIAECYREGTVRPVRVCNAKTKRSAA